MSLFSSNLSYLGIDFDSNSVKVVELKNDNGRPRLVTYGYFDRKVSQASDDTGQDFLETAKLIKWVCNQSKTTTKKVVTALPSFSVFNSILNLPAMPKKELNSAVEWEAKKVIPLPLKDMILDWKVLDAADTGSEQDLSQEGENGDLEDKNRINSLRQRKFLKISSKKTEDIKILLTAAPKDLVKKYIDIFKAAGLSLLSLDTEAFSLIRSLVGNDKSAIMIVDVGSAATSISVVGNGIPVLNRSIRVGGLAITKTIADSLKVSSEQAEQFKYDIGVDFNRQAGGGIPKLIESSIMPIIDEIKYSLNLYRGQGRKDIEKIILTGGSAMLLNLPNYLQNALNLKVYLGDSWARVIYPEDLKPVLDEIGPRYSVAIGLAMRNIQ